MIQQRIEVRVPDGTADGLFFRPDGDGPVPLVVFYMDAFGLRPALTAMAERLVGHGYAVVQPNLYWRSGPYAPFDPNTTFSNPSERARVFGLMNGFSPAQVIAEAPAFLDAVSGPSVRTDRVGLVGYCMGGRQAFFVAGGLGERVAAMACIHGGGIVKNDPSSPHLAAPRIRAELYFAVADKDPACTPADCEVLAATLTAAGVTHRIEHYPGALHGFAVPDFPIYVEAAAERHWERVLALFDATLR